MVVSIGVASALPGLRISSQLNATLGEQVYIGLGSNMARPARQLIRALETLAAEPGIEIQCQSALYRSPPWGDIEQADFINAVARVITALEPVDLLDVLLKIEQRLGRTRDSRPWGPRIIDLDLLAFGQRIVSSEYLLLPHPRIAERSFVLVPFAEIAPQFQIPGLGSVEQLLNRRTDADTIRRLGNGGLDHVNAHDP